MRIDFLKRVLQTKALYKLKDIKSLIEDNDYEIIKILHKNDSLHLMIQEYSQCSTKKTILEKLKFNLFKYENTSKNRH